MDKQSQERLENIYINIKNLAIIIIDLIPYNLKDKMIEKLKIFLGDQKDFSRYGETLEDIGDAKVKGYYSKIPVGIVYNSDLKYDILEGCKCDLPEPFVSIQVSIGQISDFYYYVIYTCKIKDEFQMRGIKETFVHMNDMVYDKETKIFSRRGPELEPNIREYQKLIENFLKEYSSGLFLNENNFITNAPNIKILSIEKIDFNNFKDWEITFRSLLRFLGIYIMYSKYDDNYLIDLSEDGLFNKIGYSSGFVFLASEDNFDLSNYVDLDSAIINGVKQFLESSIEFQNYLFSYYWIAYQMNITSVKWEDILSAELNKLKSNDDVNEILKIHKNMIDQKIIFDTYYNEENFNNMEINNSIKKYDIKNIVTPLDKIGGKINIFDFLTERCNSIINLEKTKLEDIKWKFESFFNYTNNVTNLNLNKLRLRLQNMAIMIAIISIAFSAISVYYSHQSINIATTEMKKTHPEGNYVVHVDKLGYDEPSRMDKYRIQITYYGKGESKYLSLKLEVVGVNPTVLSNVNCEVMEPNIILVRNYVDGLIGWVDYGIIRSVPNDTKLNILERSLINLCFTTI